MEVHILENVIKLCFYENTRRVFPVGGNQTVVICQSVDCLASIFYLGTLPRRTKIRKPEDIIQQCKNSNKDNKDISQQNFWICLPIKLSEQPSCYTCPACTCMCTHVSNVYAHVCVLHAQYVHVCIHVCLM